MILRVTNNAEHEQQITLHTGEAKSVSAGAAIQINTGTDRRLLGFYASLTNYEFDITAVEASGNELNNFNDIMSRYNRMKKTVDSSKGLQDKGVYPANPDPVAVQPRQVAEEPQTLPDNKPSVNLSRGKVMRPQTSVGSTNNVLIDRKTGDVVADYTQVLPDDYPEDPKAEAELKRIEMQEAQAKQAQSESDAKWYKLDELDEDKLKLILLEKFEENTRLKNKSKIIYHIIELADEEGIDVYALTDEYKGK